MSSVAVGAGAGIEFGPVGMLIGALVGLGATVLAAQAISNASGKAYSNLQSGALAQTCTDCGDGPNCEERSQRIIATMNELKQRYAEMREDKFGLYNIHPAKIPGIGSWAGHKDQFEQQQTFLRRQINEAQAKGCPIPQDAWRWATINAPSMPAP